MAATQMRRPDDPLNAAGADAPRVRAVDRQHRKLPTLATNYNDTGHAYTCWILRKTVFTAAPSVDTIRQTG